MQPLGCANIFSYSQPLGFSLAEGQPPGGQGFSDFGPKCQELESHLWLPTVALWLAAYVPNFRVLAEAHAPFYAGLAPAIVF